jgi:DNA-binding response OmpR family regulator
LDVALHRLRRKLGAIDSHLNIENIRNVGFALKTGDAAA